MDFRFIRLRAGALAVAALLAQTAAVQAQDGAAAPAPAPTATAPAKPKESVKEKPRSPYASYLAGRAAQTGGDWNTAAANMAVALAADPDNVPLMRRTFLLQIGRGDTAAAVQLARRLRDKNADSFLAATLLVADEIGRGRAAEAAKILEGLPKDGLGQYITPLLTAWARTAAGDTAGALLALETFDAKAGFAALKHLNIALIQDLSGDPKAAAESYDRAMDGNRPLRLVQLVADFHRRQGDLEAARALYQDFLATHDDNLVAAAELARLQGAKPGGDAAKARRLVATAGEGLAEALFDVSVALQAEGAHDMALLYGRIALHLRPDMPLAKLLVGETLMARDRFADGLATFRSIGGGPAMTWVPRLREADALRRLGRDAEARKLLEAMASERPERTDALVRLGDLHRAANRDTEALAAYDGALARVKRLEAQHWILLYARAMALEGAGRWPEAQAALKQALGLSPDNAHLLNFLGYAWAERGERLQEAKELIQRAMELRPDDGHIIDSMGWVAFKLGDFETAIRHLERAVEIRPMDATINDHLGDAYWAAGRRTEARFQWRRASQQAEDAALRAAVERKLSDGIELPKTAATAPPAPDGKSEGGATSTPR